MLIIIIKEQFILLGFFVNICLPRAEHFGKSLIPKGANICSKA